eukprot:364586-Chlamydomonas_euryale.AAC.15
MEECMVIEFEGAGPMSSPSWRCIVYTSVALVHYIHVLGVFWASYFWRCGPDQVAQSDGPVRPASPLPSHAQHMLGEISATPCCNMHAARPLMQRQAADKASAPPPRGALATALHVLRTEGAAGLYAGVSPAVVRHWFYSGTRITMYEQLRVAWSHSLERRQPQQQQQQQQRQQRELRQQEQRPQQQPEAQQQQPGPQQHGLGKQQPGLAAKLAMGATAGALGQLVAVPADLVKVRIGSKP